MAAVTLATHLKAVSLASHMLHCLQAKPTNKSVVELVKEATGASEEDVKHTLEECDYDVNKATNMLIDGATLPTAHLKPCCRDEQKTPARISPPPLAATFMSHADGRNEGPAQRPQGSTRAHFVLRCSVARFAGGIFSSVVNKRQKKKQVVAVQGGQTSNLAV
jgi:hypothetical protein